MAAGTGLSWPITLTAAAQNESKSKQVARPVQPAMLQMGGIDATAVAPTDNRRPNSVDPPLSHRLS
jgi:hypothetical protein